KRNPTGRALCAWKVPCGSLGVAEIFALCASSNREANSKSRLAGFRVKLDLAAVAVGDDSIANDQAQTGSGADALGRKEGFKNPGLDFRGYASPVVHDFDDQLIILDESADADLA